MASGPCAVSEKPALRAGMSLQSHWSERKSQKATPTYREHEAKREIPIWTGLYTKLMPNEW